MKLILKIAAGIIVAIVLLVAGCGVLLAGSLDEATKESDWQVEVTAPDGKCWSGAFGSKTVDGCGSKTVEFRSESITAANAQKQDGGSWTLKLALVKDGEVMDTESTEARYGIASVDGSDF